MEHSTEKRGRVSTEVEAVVGDVVEEVDTGFCGAITRIERTAAGYTVTLEDRVGKLRVFPLGPGFLVDGEPVNLIRPRPGGSSGSNGSGASGRPGDFPGGSPDRPGRRRTASGSFAVDGLRARVAREARIYVEGKHDAELVERVWGDDLRIEGVVVELLDGIDYLPGIIDEFQPDPVRRLGVLVDHLVPGSKETRLAQQVQLDREDCVLVLGHPYVDIWQAVKPASVGIEAWPHVPRNEEWKAGVCERLRRKDPDWPLDSRAAWRRILSRVNGYQDLEPTLLGRVEALIDFVTIP
jgi:Protein of unknown function (DUF3097)